MTNKTECTPEFVPVDTLGCVLGGTLASLTLLISIPQLAKLLQIKSSDGVQPLTLCLLIMYTMANDMAMVIVKWRQFTLYATDPSSAIKEQFDLMQGVFSLFAWYSILTVVVMLPPHNTLRHRGLAVGTTVLCGGMAAAAFILSVDDPCGAAPLDLASAYGFFSSACIVVAFLPQLVTTFQLKAAGSLSLVFTAIQVLGCTLVAANQRFKDKDNWYVWGPTLVSAGMQLLILGLATYYQMTGARAKVNAAEQSTRNAPLLQGSAAIDASAVESQQPVAVGRPLMHTFPPPRGIETVR